MTTVKSMVERLVSLRAEGRSLTLLAVCPHSDAVLQAAIQAAARNDAPMLFAATFNQVDRDGGYTGWTPAAFVRVMRSYAAVYECHDALFPGLAHGGQWLKDAHSRDGLSFEATTAEVKASITAMLEAGYALLHIDPTVDRRTTIPPTLDEIVTRSIDLIAYTEAERERLGSPLISYEVGTEEVRGGLADLDRFDSFLTRLRQGLDEGGLSHVSPAFAVAQVGTGPASSHFDSGLAASATDIASRHGSLIKAHNTDWVINPEQYPAVGIGGADVGPEFAAREFDALQELEAREVALAHTDPDIRVSHFGATLETAVDTSGRWRKWLDPTEVGKQLEGLSEERRTFLVKTGARYVWTDPEVVEARARLYDNLRPTVDDPHRYVVDSITESIERYIDAFRLRGTRPLLG